MSDPEAIDPPEAEAAEDRAKPRRSWPRRIAWSALGVLITMFAVVAVGVLLLDTGPGRRLVADQIQNLEFENGMRFGIGRIEGSL